MLNLAFTLAALLFFGCSTPSTSSLTSYDCSVYANNPLDYISDSLPKCDTLRRTESYTAQLVQLSGKPTVIGYICKITFTQVIIDVGGYERIAPNGTETIDRETCLKAHTTKNITLAGNNIPFLNTNGTVSHTVHVGDDTTAKANGTRGYQHIRTYEITLSESLGTADVYRNLIWFVNNVVCDYNKFACHDDKLGVVAWQDIGMHQVFVKLLYIGPIAIYTTLHDLRISHSKFQYAVLTDLYSDKVVVLKAYDDFSATGYRVLRTHILDTLIVVGSPVSFYVAGLFANASSSVLDNSYHEPAYFGGMQELEVAKRGCTDEKKRHYKSIMESFMNQTRSAHVVIGDYYFSPQMAAMCRETKATVRPTQECYPLIPVNDESNKPRFLDPLSRRLQNQSEPIPCRTENSSATSSTVSTMDFQTSATESSRTTVATPPIKNSLSPTNVLSSKEALTTEPAAQSASKSARVDWVKEILLVLFGIWAGLVLVRLTKFVTRGLPKDPANQNVDDVSCFSVGTLVQLFKPPFMQKSFSWKNENGEKMSELGLRHDV